MATFLFFVGTPLFFGLLQFFVTRSGLSRGKKYLPLVLVALTAAITWGAAFGHVPLPKTFFIDGGSGFLPFPDFAYVGLFCFPALFGIMMGALFGVSDFGKEDKK